MKRVSPPLVLLAVAILAYGPLIPRLGFYWDDLPMSWVRYQLGTEAMTQYFSTNRPVWGLLYQVTTRLLPHYPIYWQVLALIGHWLTAVSLWALCRRLWPAQWFAAIAASLFFLLYPGFNQHWVSYLYSHFFVVLLFYLTSLNLMLRGGLIGTLVALLLAALNLWMLEYFFVLELARPAVIWLSGRVEAKAPPQDLRTLVRRWLPFLLVFLLAVISRLFVFNNQIYGFGIRQDFAANPVTAFTRLILTVMQSLWTATAGAWGQVFRVPQLAEEGPRTLAFGIFVALAAAALAALLLARAGRDLPGRPRALIGFGLLMLLLGGPPFWLTGVPVALDFPASRAMLAFGPGASLVLAGLLLLVPSPLLRLALVSALVGLAAGRQFLWSNDFRRDWESHKQFFWQLNWRVPALAPNTIVLGNQAFDFYADNSMGAALNWIYHPGVARGDVDYVFFFPTNRLGGSLPSLQPGMPVSYSYLAGDFHGTTSQTLAVLFAPPGCLRVLDPEIDPHNRLISDESLMREAASLSSNEWIMSSRAATMPAAYGAEPRHGWCYYFEQADLARQHQDWGRVAALGDSALALGDHPNDPLERFVFIEGFAHTGQWQRAKDLTAASYGVSERVVGPLLCRLWDRIGRQVPADAQGAASLAEVRTKLACSE